MSNQDKRFWSEFPEDELKDPATRQVLGALHDVYRIDDDDRQSVQHAWQRIAMNLDQQKQKRAKRADKQEDISRFNTLHELPELPASFAMATPKTPVTMQRRSARRRIDVLVAVIIFFLLVGSMLGVVAYHQSASTMTAGHPSTPITTHQVSTPVALPRLGTSLGKFFLGMSLTDGLMSQLCLEARYPQGKMLNRFCTVDPGYIVISLSNLPKQQDYEIVQIVAQRNFSSGTAEGLLRGTTLQQFETIYKQFTPVFSTASDSQRNNPQAHLNTAPVGTRAIATIKDGYGTTLIAVFDQSQQVIEIVLQSSEVKDITPITKPTPVG